MRALLPLLFLLALAACAPPLPPGDMVPMTQVYDQIPANEALQRNIRLGAVTVFEHAGGATAPVKPEAYREAIQNALLTSNMAARAGDQSGFILDANLLELDVPLFGFNMTASAKARYRLKRTGDGFMVLDETITLPYTAEFGESLDGNIRARLATAKAIRENITHMIRVLAAKPPAELTGKEE